MKARALQAEGERSARRPGFPGGRKRSAVGAVAAAVLLFLFVTSAVTVPWTSRWYDVQDLDVGVRHPPSFAPVVPQEHFAEKESAAFAARALHRAASWFGHDNLGRSLMFRVLAGFLVSFSIGAAAAAVAGVIGVLWGSTAALAGGRIDLLMMRVVDVLYGLPYILTVILLKIALTPPLTYLFAGHRASADLAIMLLAIGGVSWLTPARVARGQVLSLKNQPFVEAARAAGAGPVYILWRHMVPNLIGPVVTYVTLVVPQAILQESFLSFLGIGIQPPVPSLGRLAADGVEAVNTFVGYWWLIVFPCAALVISLLALNFLGDALRDAFDPKRQVALVT